MKYLLILFFCFNSFLLFGQSFEGKYFGNFLDPENIVSIELKKGQYFATILTSSKTTFVVDCELVEGSLRFFVPLNDEKKLRVTAVSIDQDLELSFTLEGENYTALLKRIGTQTVSKDNNKEKIDKPFLDPEIMGKWIQLGSHYPSGEPTEVDFSTKGYYKVFTKDGRIINDSRMFRDVSAKNGHSFSYSDIPDFNWSMRRPNILITSSPEFGSFEEEYYIQNDSLILKTTGGFKTYFVREIKD
ncbi:hypothetical protein [Algoriphagus antarcticus]|uniref:Uncharacterized protein n=1 Tax=Algoriphagus antarcticus TaxID=238540 RepID=A0A3E0DP50_9BACT|nr:hypothetical protein [Algoriphagus antarcticus]REG84724.1 hypothetical protein C8N25_11473 [Algoriphagus antarcticus]